MFIFNDESELLKVLADHDKLIIDCANGSILFDKFILDYDSFPMKYSLNGLDSDEEEKEILEIHKSRYEPHWRVWNDVITNLCEEHNAVKEEYINIGRIGSAEGLKRIKIIAKKFYSKNDL